MPTSINVSMQSRAAAVMPQSVNEDARTAEFIFTTGAMVRRFDWLEGEYEEELVVTPDAVRMERMSSGAPLCADHATWAIENVHGVVERAWIEGGQGKMLVRFSDDEDSDKIWRKVKSGILRFVSVGYMVHAYQEVKEGARRILRAVDWEPVEVSLVAVPADAGAMVRSKPVSQTPCIIHRSNNQPTKEEVMTTEANGADAGAENPANPPADAAPAADAAAAPAADAAAPAAGEGETRAIEIMELCAIAGQPMVRAMEYVRSGKPVAEVRAALMAARDAKIAGETEISSHVLPPAEQKTGGTAERMQARFAEGAKNTGGKASLASRMQARFSA